MIRTKSTLPTKPRESRQRAAPALPAPVTPPKPKTAAPVPSPVEPAPIAGDKTMHDDWTPELKELIGLAGVSRQEVADGLRVSISTVNAWLKPATSKSANPTPMWAVELFRYKFAGRLRQAAASQKN